MEAAWGMGIARCGHHESFPVCVGALVGAELPRDTGDRLTSHLTWSGTRMFAGGAACNRTFCRYRTVT